MANPLQYVSVYYCKTCEHHTGLFFAWNETEDETDIDKCPVCSSEEYSFIEDIEIGR